MKTPVFCLLILFLSTSVLMGQKKQELSKNPFKEAVYLTENAFYENSIDYSEFQKAIKGDVNLCNIIIES